MTISISCDRFTENKWMKCNENKATKVSTKTTTIFTTTTNNNTIINNATINTTTTTPTSTTGDLQQ